MYNSIPTHYYVCTLMYTHMLIKQLQLGNMFNLYCMIMILLKCNISFIEDQDNHEK